MADTIITNTPERTVENDNGALGVVLALIVLAAVVIGGIYLYRHGGVGVPNTGGTNINVTVPSPTDSGAGSGSGSGDSTGGNSAQ